jgi:pyruvate dehydrogenase E2 component (dihydrolipoamide acetyltransferase)
MTAGILATWRKKPGEHVEHGEIIAEIETEKGLIEVESFATGVVTELLVEEGTKVPVGTVLARIEDSASVSGAEAGSGTGAVAAERADEPRVAAGPRPESRRGGTPPTAAESGPQPHHATPAARRLAHERGLDAERLEGTGRHGTVTKEDVARASRPPAVPVARGGLRGSPYARRLAHERGVDWRTLSPSADGVVHADAVSAAPAASAAPADSMRGAIAAAMTRSSREIPHYYVGQTIDLGPALAFVERENAERDVHDRLLPGVLLLHATIRALSKYPRFNGHYQGGSFVASERVHLGVAVSLKKRGLIAPAILDADRLSLDELMRAFRDLVTRTKKGQLRGRELGDPTATVTSLGERGVEDVQPLIVPPQVAMIGFGGIVERPWVLEGDVVPRPTIRCTLGADHRVTDGHDGSRLVAEIERLLESPEELGTNA